MAYRFKRKESIESGVRRIGLERIQRAIARFDQADDPLDAVHDVRQDIKMVRALLRLMCPPPKLVQRDVRLLRKAAALLAGVRDARVKLQTFQEIIGHFQHQLDEHPFPKVHQALDVYCDRQGRLFIESDSTARVIDFLRKIESHAADWRIDAGEWPALAPGFLGSYRCGRREHQLVRDKPSARNFHGWRKRVKDLGYQLRLVRPAWPQIIRPTIAAVNQLGEYLGDDHDAAILQEELHGQQLSAPADEVETLEALIDQRQRELRACALALGARLYAEKPGRFCERLGAYWCQWRRHDDKALANPEVMRRTSSIHQNGDLPPRRHRNDTRS